MQQSQPWEFMVKDTPARHWAEGMGSLIAFAFFCGGVAGGLYLSSLYFNNLIGMFIAWIFALGMGLFDMAHLNNKAMVWRIASRPNSSWISRGFLFVTFFIGSAAIQMALTYWAPGTPWEIVFKIIAGFMALGVAMYSGFVVSYVNCIKFWNSTIMPILFVIAGLTAGASILLVVSSFTGSIQFADVRVFAVVALVVYTIIIALHLWVSTYNSTAAHNSVMSIIGGNLAGVFWPVIVFVGIIIPLLIMFLVDSGAEALLIVNAVCILSGNLALRYIILKAGRYSSLLPVGR
jgi:formate-dependent nitrite reductase membrane component NrfD